MSSKALKAFKLGNFNDMSQEKQSDGTVIITLNKRTWKKPIRFRVRNLYQSNEKEVDLATGRDFT